MGQHRDFCHGHRHVGSVATLPAETSVANRGLKMAHASNFHPPSSTIHPLPVFLAGPTAVGKSEIALLLAEKLGGEIISVDSMQVYRGLDIGTAKPSPIDRARVPHHLIDAVELTVPFDAAKFVLLANQAVTEIQSRGR